METEGVKIKYKWEIFNRIFLTIWVLTRFYNNFFDSVILYICGVLTADYFYNSKKSGDNDEKIKDLLSPTWLSPRHSKLIHITTYLYCFDFSLRILAQFL